MKNIKLLVGLILLTGLMSCSPRFIKADYDGHRGYWHGGYGSSGYGFKGYDSSRNGYRWYGYRGYGHRGYGYRTPGFGGYGRRLK